MVLHLHTFLFADLVGFTSFTVREGDERAADLALSFHERVRELACEHDCEVVKVLGDGVMVRGANGGAVIELARRLVGRREEERLPSVRAGLDTGPAAERAGDWFGSTVNTAARVAAVARPGELLMTERTREASAGLHAVEARQRGRRRLKGLPEHALFGLPGVQP